MTTVLAQSTENIETKERPPLAARLARNADGILEQIAKEYGVATLEVVRSLPQDQRTIVPGAQFEAVMTDVSLWGEIMFIVHTPTSCSSARERFRRERSRAAISTCTATARSAGTSRSTAARRSRSWRARSWDARRARSSSSMPAAKPCSRYSCGVTRRASCCPSRSRNSRHCGGTAKLPR